MSQENVAAMRRATDAYNAGDMDAFLSYFSEDVYVRPDATRFPEARPLRGREQYRRFLDQVNESWEGRSAVRIRELYAVKRRVLLRMDWGGRGKASGLEMVSDLTMVIEMDAGKGTRVDYFFDHAEALEAVGLREQPASNHN